MTSRQKKTTKQPARRGGSLMGMRSGFRKLAGRGKKGKRIDPALQRAIVYGIGVLVVLVLIYALSHV